MLRLHTAVLLVVALAVGSTQGATIVLRGLLSGAGKQSQKDVVRAGTLAVDAVNRNPTILGNHTLRITWADDAGNAWMGLRCMCNFSLQGVHMVVGPGYSSVAVAVSRLATAIQVPFVSYSATSAALSDRTTHPFFGRVVVPDTLQSAAIVGLVARFGWTRICLLHVDDTYGTAGGLATRDAAKRHGISVSTMQAYSQADHNATAAVTESVSQFQCRIFVVWCTDCGTVMRSAREAGALGKASGDDDFTWIMSDGCGNDDAFGSLRKDMIGTFCVRPGTADGTARAAYLDAWDTDTNGEPGTYSYYAYDSVIAAALAIDGYSKRVPAVLTEPFVHTGRCLTSPEGVQTPYKHGKGIHSALAGVTFAGVTSGNASFKLSPSFEPERSTFNVVNMQSYGLTGGVHVLVATADLSAASLAAGTVAPITIVQAPQWGTKDGKITSDSIALNSRPLRVLTLVGMTSTAPFQSFDFNKPGIKCDAGLCNPSGPPRLVTTCPLECYSGIAPDLLVHVMGVAGIAYTLHHVMDGFGYKNAIDTHLQAAKDSPDKYDVIVGDWTSTSIRAEVLDLSYPYVDLSLSLMLRKEAETKVEFYTHLWAFGNPFSAELWGTILLYVFVAGLGFFIFENGANKSIKPIVYDGVSTAMATEPNDIRDQVNYTHNGLLTSLFWSATSFTLAGNEVTPATTPGKLLSVGYLFCNVILLASYTANLVTHLSRPTAATVAVQGLDGVGLNKPIRFDEVCLASTGATIENFWDLNPQLGHNNPASCYNCKGTLHEKTADGNGWSLGACIALLKKKDPPIKAILGDRPILEYIAKKDECDLRVGSSKFFLQGYSFMSNKGTWGSKVINKLNIGILKKREDLTIEQIQGRYEPTSCGHAEATKNLVDPLKRVYLTDVGGVFLLASCTLLAALALHLYCYFTGKTDAKAVSRQTNVAATYERSRAATGSARDRTHGCTDVGAPVDTPPEAHLSTRPQTSGFRTDDPNTWARDEGQVQNPLYGQTPLYGSGSATGPMCTVTIAQQVLSGDRGGGNVGSAYDATSAGLNI